MKDLHIFISCLLAYVFFTFSGTTNIKNLDDNIGSLRVELRKEDLKEISDVLPINDVAGARITDHFYLCSWQFADTPARNSKTPT